MSFLPLFNSVIAGSLLVSLFLWKIEILPVVLVLLAVSVLFFWYDLIHCSLHYASAFWLFILSEVMAFGSILFCCFYFDSTCSINLSSPLEIPFLGCFVLLGSSVTVTGFHHLIGWNWSWVLLVLTFVLGLSFVGLQMLEMNEIIMLLYDSSFYASSLCTVGLHFSHVLLGAVGILILLILGVDNSGYYRCTVVTWYWHFVDYIWLFVYTFVYIC
uniref:Cytochrome c oxidase subunit 3 n=1 Tax=Rhinebothriidae sp. DJM-2021 TaxID=2899516 RepID=A0A8K1SY79_9CEST|nr:cytochrome c oxidase subunit III [Rhinebothriidae sp. DJM-2021]